MKKVLVTGADGFIGSHLTENLLEKGYEVKAFTLYNSFNTWGWLDSLPKEKLDQLKPGHGGVVEYHGEKAGVYKAEDGQVFAVSVKCPHMGCQLTWNPDEKSWDCPCHGSRFDYRGRLIDGPAQTAVDGEFPQKS